jgi:hypothetical protein
MHHEVLVSVLHGECDPHAEFDSIVDRETLPIAVGTDRDAFDEFHRKPRSIVLERPAVDESCDVRMIKGGEHLPLEFETFDHRLVGGRSREDLDGHPLPETAFGTKAFPDFAESTTADRHVGFDSKYADSIRSLESPRGPTSIRG